MAISLAHASFLAEVMKSYYGDNEIELYGLMKESGMDLDVYCSGNSILYTKFACDLIKDKEHFDLLKSLVATFMSWSRLNINKFYSHESVEYYEDIMHNLRELEAEVQMSLIESEVYSPEKKPFLAKSKVRDLLGNAETRVVVIDNYVGVRSLDCLRDLNQPILIVTGAHNEKVKPEFERALDDFRRDGHLVEIRRHGGLHDRYISFNDRCWIVGSSLKDAGSRSFNIVEVKDTRVQVLDYIGAKIEESEPYL